MEMAGDPLNTANEGAVATRIPAELGANESVPDSDRALTELATADPFDCSARRRLFGSGAGSRMGATRPSCGSNEFIDV